MKHFPTSTSLLSFFPRGPKESGLNRIYRVPCRSCIPPHPHVASSSSSPHYEKELKFGKFDLVQIWRLHGSNGGKIIRSIVIIQVAVCIIYTRSWKPPPSVHTPWKINMEPTNHPFRRKIIFQTSMSLFHVNLPGCTYMTYVYDYDIL